MMRTYFEQRGASREEIGIQSWQLERLTKVMLGVTSPKGSSLRDMKGQKVTFLTKSCKVVFAIREWGIAVVTVIVRFGTWEEILYENNLFC